MLETREDHLSQAIKIAVMESQIEGLREQHKAHKEEITKTLTEMSKSVTDAINGIRADIKDIYEFINRSKGSIAILLLAASALGGLVVAFSSWALTHFLH